MVIDLVRSLVIGGLLGGGYATIRIPVLRYSMLAIACILVFKYIECHIIAFTFGLCSTSWAVLMYRLRAGNWS